MFDVLFCLYAIVMIPFLFLSGKWHGGFRQRSGIFPEALRERLSSARNIWVHAVSVGEVLAVEKVLRQLKEVYPSHQIVLTVTTRTGYALASSKLEEVALVLWSPLDFSWTVRRFLSAISPCLYVAAETEIWPNLFLALHRAGVPIVIVNARLSDRAYSRYCRVRGFLKGVLAGINRVCAQSETDADRFCSVGVPPESVRVVGNIKFDGAPDERKVLSFRGALFSETHKIFLGGSLHPGEDRILLDVFCAIRSGFPTLRLVLVPRHPHRATAFSDSVRAHGLHPVLFSSGRNVAAQEDVLIVDTIGHLSSCYSRATVVFVGKSLVVGGGQNIIEPAALRKAVIVGPLMGNFRDVLSLFLKDNAVIQVADAHGLQRAVLDLLSDQGRRESMGRRAFDVVQRNKGAAMRITEIIREVLPCP